MKTGDIYRIPESQLQGQHYLRAVLRLDDLDLAGGHSMQFVARAWLIQVASTPSFDASATILDGCFLVRHGTLSRCGYEKIGSVPINPSALEFPCWFSDYNNATYVCRGELRYPVSRAIFDRWLIRLSAPVPDGLGWLLTHRRQYLHAIAMGQRPPLVGLPASDARHHPMRETILEEAGVSLATPYLEAVRTLGGAARLHAYHRALNAPHGA